MLHYKINMVYIAVLMLVEYQTEMNISGSFLCVIVGLVRFMTVLMQILMVRNVVISFILMHRMSLGVG